MYVIPTTSVWNLKNVFQSKKISKSAGFYNISPKAIKAIICIIAQPLCDIFNKSLSTVLSPDIHTYIQTYIHTIFFRPTHKAKGLNIFRLGDIHALGEGGGSGKFDITLDKMSFQLTIILKSSKRNQGPSPPKALAARPAPPPPTRNFATKKQSK